MQLPEILGSPQVPRSGRESAAVPQAWGCIPRSIPRTWYVRTRGTGNDPKVQCPTPRQAISLGARRGTAVALLFLDPLGKFLEDLRAALGVSLKRPISLAQQLARFVPLDA